MSSFYACFHRQPSLPQFEMPPVEPLYCQVQVFNIRERRRLSEVRSRRLLRLPNFRSSSLFQIGYVYGEYNPTLIDLAARQTTAAPETQVQKLIVTIDDPVRALLLVSSLIPNFSLFPKTESRRLHCVAHRLRAARQRRSVRTLLWQQQVHQDQGNGAYLC